MRGDADEGVRGCYPFTRVRYAEFDERRRAMAVGRLVMVGGACCAASPRDMSRVTLLHVLYMR